MYEYCIIIITIRTNYIINWILPSTNSFELLIALELKVRL